MGRGGFGYDKLLVNALTEYRVLYCWPILPAIGVPWCVRDIGSGDGAGGLLRLRTTLAAWQLRSRPTNKVPALSNKHER